MKKFFKNHWLSIVILLIIAIILYVLYKVFQFAKTVEQGFLAWLFAIAQAPANFGSAFGGALVAGVFGGPLGSLLNFFFGPSSSSGPGSDLNTPVQGDSLNQYPYAADIANSGSTPATSLQYTPPQAQQ